MKSFPFALILCHLPLCGQSATLLNETYDVGASPNINDNFDDPNDTAWTQFGGGSIFLATPSGFTGNAMRNQSNSTPRGHTGSFSATTLSNVGDKLSLSLRFATANAPILPTVGNGYNIGLFNASDAGYFVRIGAQSARVELLKDDGTGNPADGGVTSLSLDTTAGASQFDSNVPKLITIDLTRTASGLQIDTDIDGFTLSATDTTAVQYDFSAVATTVGGGHSIDWFQDDIFVAFEPIPEPTGIVLLSIGFTGFFLRRRR
ncbi:MAG: PEP-CTERM sorting domain-containing protein [Akkermansiaceae bacterium]